MLSLVRVISSGLHIVTDTNPETKPATKFRYFQSFFIYVLILLLLMQIIYSNSFKIAAIISIDFYSYQQQLKCIYGQTNYLYKLKSIYKKYKLFQEVYSSYLQCLSIYSFVDSCLHNTQTDLTQLMISTETKINSLQAPSIDNQSQIPDLSFIQPSSYQNKILLLTGQSLVSSEPSYVRFSIQLIPNHKVYIMYTTSYRIYLSSSLDQQIITIPHAYIKDYTFFDTEIRFTLKTSLKCFLIPEESSSTNKIYQSLKEAKQLVPFCFQFHFEDQEPQVYDCLAEMDRMLINWKKILAVKNIKGQFCATYPKTIFVPAKINCEVVQQCKKSRVYNRIPVLTFFDSQSGVSLWRGGRTIKDHNSKYDYCYLQSISQNLLIIEIQQQDNRKQSIYGFNHFNNQIKHSIYRFQTLASVRSNYEKMLQSYLKNQSVLKSAAKWFQQIDFLLKCSFKCAQYLNQKRHVLIQQNDGENIDNLKAHFTKGGIDRACQISALTSIISDPFYRSIKGLTLIIQKQFISFGYPFQDRCGIQSEKIKESNLLIKKNSADIKDLMNSVYGPRQSSKLKTGDEFSPTFIQFLQCLNQLINCYPDQFQYTSFFLAHLGYELYTGKYNNFLFNSIYQKQCEQRIKNTQSLCRYCAMKKRYYNLQFKINTNKNKTKLTELRSVPNIKQFIIWKEYWKIASEMNSVENQGCESKDYRKLKKLVQERKQKIFKSNQNSQKQ